MKNKKDGRYHQSNGDYKKPTAVFKALNTLLTSPISASEAAIGDCKTTQSIETNLTKVFKGGYDDAEKDNGLRALTNIVG